MTEEKLINEICKEICFYDEDGPICNAKCEKCNNIYWRHMKKKVKIGIKAYRKLEGKNEDKIN